MECSVVPVLRVPACSGYITRMRQRQPLVTRKSPQRENPCPMEFDGVRYRLAIHLAWVGLNWWSSKFTPNSSRVFHRLATSANSNSRQVVLLLYMTTRSYSDNWMVYLRAGSIWRYRLATRRCKFCFCNLARVGLSWEYRLARASGSPRTYRWQAFLRHVQYPGNLSLKVNIFGFNGNSEQ